VLKPAASAPRSPTRAIALALAAIAVAAALAACGTQGISVPKSSAYYKGAVLFQEHCSGCHSLAVVGAYGSATNIRDRLRNQGPNFNYRKETVENVLFAIRNGGFSGVIMPQNIVLGEEAQEVAHFLAAYAGEESQKVPTVEIPPEEATEAAAKASGASGASGTPTATGGTAAVRTISAHTPHK